MARNTDIATRAVVVFLKSPAGGKTTPEIAEIMGLSKRTINDIYARALARGFDPNKDLPLNLHDEHLRDAARSGRPSKQTNEKQQEVIAK
ncbi:hypothetical protein BGZ63DRAFT_518315 [Mariannaea sp. PMI_226]|nr:hypothetical protein BGZ63DRAFT_518315 [Mariannaea sp. PMI_226]